jgi:hypothetical protein
MEALFEALDAMSRAGAQLRADLDELDRATDGARRRLEKGTTLRELYEGRPASNPREAVARSLTGLNAALRRVRSEAVRVLVDEEKLSIGEAARLVGHPRQLVRRLYDSRQPRVPAGDGGDPEE